MRDREIARDTSGRKGGVIPWLATARAGWLLATVAAMSMWVLGSYETTRALPASCQEVACDPFALSADDLAVAGRMGLPETWLNGLWAVTNVSFGLIFLATAIFIWRRADSGISLLVAFVLVFLGTIFFTESDDALYRAYPALRPLLSVMTAVGLSATVALFFYFPDGRLVPGHRVARIAIWAALILMLPFTPRLSRSPIVTVWLLYVLVLFGLGAQVYRYRRLSGPVARQQTKGVIVGLAFALLVMLIWTYVGAVWPPAEPSRERLLALLAVRPLILVLVSALPVSFALAILRYRLWDIDLVIRRTLIYAVSSGLLVLAYFSSVVLLQAGFTALTGQESAVAIVISTLAIAALFNPLRRRVQAVIDRRFYRQKVDAARALAAFAVTARDETDLDRLAEALQQVVQTTMAPERLALWLKAGASAWPTGRTPYRPVGLNAPT